MEFSQWLALSGFFRLHSSEPLNVNAGLVFHARQGSMALIREFQRIGSDKTKIHQPVSCGWRAFHVGDEKILQLDTYGSDTRKIPNKVSQSIQLDRDSAALLIGLIRDTFPGL